jgi:hypothetical protein
MTRIELGSPSISQKKHLIGYWVSDKPYIKLDCSSIDNTSNTRIWFETGSYNGKFFSLQITETLNSHGNFEYHTITITEFDKLEFEKTSAKELDELDLEVALVDDTHILRLHRTK